MRRFIPTKQLYSWIQPSYLLMSHDFTILGIRLVLLDETSLNGNTISLSMFLIQVIQMIWLIKWFTVHRVIHPCDVLLIVKLASFHFNTNLLTYQVCLSHKVLNLLHLHSGCSSRSFPQWLEQASLNGNTISLRMYSIQVLRLKLSIKWLTFHTVIHPWDGRPRDALCIGALSSSKFPLSLLISYLLVLSFTCGPYTRSKDSSALRLLRGIFLR